MIHLVRMIRRWKMRFHKMSNRSIFLAVLSIVGVVLLHSVLFYFAENNPPKNPVSLWDSFWVTLTTITTVGYGDISARTVYGRLVTIGLGYLVGLSLFAWLAGQIATLWLEGLENERRGMKQLDLSGHYLIINYPSTAKVRLIIEQFRAAERTKETPLVVVTDAIESLPFKEKEVYFVHGNVTTHETYARAALKEARFALILAQDPNDQNTDALTSAVVSTVESLAPEIKTVAECVFQHHLPLFRHVQCDQIVFTGDLLAHIMVQETQDEGTSLAIARLLDRSPGTNQLYRSDPIYGCHGRTFGQLSQALLSLEERIFPVGVVDRDEGNKIQLNPPRDLKLQEGDQLIYISQHRPDWKKLEGTLKIPE